MRTKKNEICVGIFMLLSLIAILFLCLRVANVKLFGTTPIWKLYATFDNIGNLKINAPVKIGGVVIGRVTDISLDEKMLLPCVTMSIEDKYDHIPDTSSLTIRTQGLLGEQYLALDIGFDDNTNMNTSFLKNGDKMHDTKSTMRFEDLIGQLLYNKSSSNN